MANLLVCAAVCHVVGGGPVAGPPANVLPPEVVGLDYPVAPAMTITLTAREGRWDGAHRFTYRWRYVGGKDLGRGRTIELNPNADPSMLGKAVEVEVTAFNKAGRTKVRSHWFGPLEAGPPAAVPEYESEGNVGPTD